GGSAFGPGVGMPGRIWESGSPVWIPDVPRDQNFPRADVATRAGLHGAVGFPVRLGDEVLGVIEFFSREIRQPDNDLLRLFATIGGQIGQFMERWRSAEALREADRRKDEFLATLAHELRNPLAPIRNALEIMRLARGSGAAAQQAQDVMERQVLHLARLVDDLLDVARINRGRIELRREPVELASVVSRAVETSRPLIDAAGHELAVELPDEPVRLD